MATREREAAASSNGDAAGTAVRLEKLRKVYGDNVVLDDLDLEVTPGEKLVIVGPSGSGKTTILRAIMTLERPDGGYIFVGDDELYHEERNGELVPADEKHTRRVRSKVSMVFQHFHLFPHMTVEKNLMLGPTRSLDVSKADARDRARELLDMVGLADKVDEYPSALSGGQKQRVAIARALAMEPEVMLFDEVTSALDPELVGEVLDVLRRLGDETDVTMILVTHEMGFAREFGDRMVMFDEGRAVEIGKPEQLFENPTEERTRSFLEAVLSH